MDCRPDSLPSQSNALNCSVRSQQQGGMDIVTIQQKAMSSDSLPLAPAWANALQDGAPSRLCDHPALRLWGGPDTTHWDGDLDQAHLCKVCLGRWTALPDDQASERDWETSVSLKGQWSHILSSLLCTCQLSTTTTEAGQIPDLRHWGTLRIRSKLLLETAKRDSVCLFKFH